MNPQVAYAFEHLAKVCFEHFGEKLQNWITFNEPKWFIVNGYFIGNYPPGLQDVQKTMVGAYNVMLASALGVRAFRAGNYQWQIGFTLITETEAQSYTPEHGNGCAKQ